MSRKHPYDVLGDNIELVEPFREFIVLERDKTYHALIRAQRNARDVAPLAQLALCTDFEPQNVPPVIIEFSMHATNAERQRVKLELLDVFYQDCVENVSQSVLDFAGKNERDFYMVWLMYVESRVAAESAA